MSAVVNPVFLLMRCLDATHAIAHSKVTIFDGETVIHGELQLQQGGRGEQR